MPPTVKYILAGLLCSFPIGMIFVVIFILCDFATAPEEDRRPQPVIVDKGIEVVRFNKKQKLA